MTLSSPTWLCAGCWAPLWGHLYYSAVGTIPASLSLTIPGFQSHHRFPSPFFALSHVPYGSALYFISWELWHGHSRAHFIFWLFKNIFLKFLIGGKLLYNVVLVFAIQKCKSVIISYIYVCPLLHQPSCPFHPTPLGLLLFAFRLPVRSLCFLPLNMIRLL